MLEEELTSENMIKYASYSIIVSLFLLIFYEFEFGIMVLATGISLGIFGFFTKKHSNKLFIFLLKIILMIFIGCSIYFSFEISSYMRLKAPIQKICGSVKNINISKNRHTPNTFELVNKRKVVTFLYYQEDKELFSSPNICIEYAFDDRWESYPRVFKIESESIH
ncbi:MULTISPECIES: hypothetical protein [Acinetobacter]|uniref:hypothetical protein n=1 Tax=Acinetobacter TaxID=469 RepID=UPI00019AE62D|nr:MULTISPECIES: hypothetical protein [Acinetobacter]EEH68152.1 hypothetical protein HMPREF0023_2314 [Acinetobacter sp. ATCC 27244]NAR71477.1 hypothetical protein [Acinetobacter haemolyticus]NAR85588.1 hypothetical protein [Acinetobacter haemolyticus]QHI15908.1 hypothetical protein AhaeAN4_04425 [Acinetobacter haemolyticus]QHI26952.1 hypothetical protein Ahae2126ch_12740 [Acinetobacter haemolyticus]